MAQQQTPISIRLAGVVLSAAMLWACGDDSRGPGSSGTAPGAAGSGAFAVGGAGNSTINGVGGASDSTINGVGGAVNTTVNGVAGDSNNPIRFESDNPMAASGGSASGTGASVGGSSSAAAGAAASADASASKEAERAIVEADIVQVVGDTLYALSNYSGLSVIDIAAPSNLRMLGRYSLRADPFEMYVRDGVAYAMYSAFPRYEYNATSGTYTYITSSRLVAIDARNPAAMKALGTFDMPGTISDSRLVGDIVYVVSYENGSCWGCAANKPRTTITSIRVADPASISQIEQLAFEDQKATTHYWSYKRSITVNTDRMYVSGMNYTGTWGSDTGNSTIQVVDISDPGGKLVLGAEVAVTGQIESRWQMDEYDGVLRVLSQAGSTWTNGPAPTLETFRVESAQTLTPLGKLTLTLPTRENLKSVRFDGDRAYAVTFLQTDPLFTIDVSDPAAPLQMGEVQMPGYLYHMEPRGDRMIALGMDNGNTAGGMTVSVFDVADLANPSLLSRANFGTNWGWAPEDQDRIHKAFKIFDDVGLIAMPFSGWSYSSGSCGRYSSGVQLFDFTRDTVTARGVVPVKGQAKRALLHKSNLLAVSDDQVGAFDISNRDAPTQLDTLALSTIAHKSVRVGEQIVSLGLDWWTQTPQITVTPLAAEANGVPIATIELAASIDSNVNRCYGYWGAFYRSAELFVNGKQVYLVYDAGFGPTTSANENTGKGSIGFAVVDLTDPAAPKLAGTKLLPLAQPLPSDYRYSYYYYYSYGFATGYYNVQRGIWPSGRRVVQVGSTVLLQELVPIGALPADYWSTADSSSILHAVELSDPANIREVSALALSNAISAGGMFSQGRTIMTSTYDTVPENPAKVRFYVEQIDYTDPTSPKRARINVPGSLLAVDAGGNRIVTVDYARRVESIPQTAGTNYCSYGTCSDNRGLDTVFYEYEQIDMGDYSRYCPVTCVRVERSLKLVDLLSDGAKLIDTYEPTGERVQQVLAGDDRLWLLRYDSTGNNRYQFEIVSGVRAGALALSSTIPGSSYGYATSQALGTKVFFTDYNTSQLKIYDSVDPAAPKALLEAELGFQYWNVTDIAVDSTHAIVSAGNYGAWAVAY